MSQPIPPPFSFYGSKHRLSRCYPRPETQRIIEPFAGTASYSRRYWRPGLEVLLYDIDPIIVGIWEWLIQADFEKVMSLPLVQTREDLEKIEDPNARNLVAFNLNSSSTRPARSPSSWMKSGLKKSTFWGEFRRERLARSVSNFDSWKIENLDYRDIDKDIEGTWFVDPPYIGKKGSHYKHGSGLIDYESLGQWIMNLQTQVIACDADDASYLDFETLSVLSGTSRSRTKELVYKKGFKKC